VRLQQVLIELKRPGPTDEIVTVSHLTLDESRVKFDCARSVPSFEGIHLGDESFQPLVGIEMIS
jgi:hypothetical protein